MKILENKNFCIIINGDSQKILKNFRTKVDLIVTSPPYADARKKHYDSIHPDSYTSWFLSFSETFWDILNNDGSFILNIKDKVVNGTRHRFVWETILKLNKKGWLSIDDYIWNKPNPMPGYWPTRFRDAWEYCFHLSKSPEPFMDQKAVMKPVGNWVKTRLQKLGSNDLSRHNSSNKSGFGRNISNWTNKKDVLPTNVLTVPLVGKNKGHPAVFPLEIPSFFIKLLSKPNSLILDPFAGSGTTGIAALSLGRNCVLVDNNIDYCKLAFVRIHDEVGNLLYNIILLDEKGSIIQSSTSDIDSKFYEAFFFEHKLTA